ncbi:MAG: NUDIX hydrolase [uncultured bacterium]|uniref:Nudix hydrolase domain-containing protein n=1 Tax=candidate division WWE3 bacterium RBG_16_37_10 TaxID=1802610 RepID=A0A1F4UXS9_UNCKA|nr:MAG: NUDIX hydrolase [uncultured bacterium]OGC49650.1 MAG: hypothetical protein A2W32_04915 [candidate division WWE3 bacterium RBG_16_37_10]
MKLKVYTALFILDQKNNILGLKRSQDSVFEPNKVTGIGGEVEKNELVDIEHTLRRELEEETHISFSGLKEIKLRGTKHTVNQSNETEHLIYYYTAKVNAKEVINLYCNEGTLAWFNLNEFGKQDLIHGLDKVYKYIFDFSVNRFSSVYDKVDDQAVIKIS